MKLEQLSVYLESAYTFINLNFHWFIVLVCSVVAFLIPLISVYKFYLEYISKKIKFFVPSLSKSLFNGSQISIIIENCAQSPICITQIELVMDNKYILSLKRFEEPLILQPSIAIKVEGDIVSFYNPDITNILDKNTFLIIQTTKGRLIATNNKWYKNWFKKNENKYIKVQNITKMLDGQLISNQVKYAIFFNTRSNENKRILISSGGVIDDLILGLNYIPLDFLKSPETLKNFISPFLRSLNVSEFMVWRPNNQRTHFRV